jgi:GWxTD domain-containing protein
VSPVAKLFRKKGHLRGGLFFSARVALLPVGAAIAACAQPAPPTASPADVMPDSFRVPNPLAVYSRLGFVVGNYDFPAVGRFAFLPGPADSSYAIFALSLPNNALRFRSDDPGFLARYHVRIVVGDSATVVDSLAVTQEVRVRTFRETARRDESVLFQGFLLLAPGTYPATIEVRDLASRDGFAAAAELQVPRFDAADVTTPIVVYRAEGRSSRDEPPALIINPRATVGLEDPGPMVYVESLAGGAVSATLEVLEDGVVTGSDTLRAGAPGTMRAYTDSLDQSLLAPGALTLRTGLAGQAPADSTVLVVALVSDWVTTDYHEALDFLRYAGTYSELDSLQIALPGERGRLLRTFWKGRDPDPETPENEFFDRYFRKIQDANDRFSGMTGPGWLTDRGAVYITLGPPDEVTRHLDTRQEQGQSQVWLYDESLGYELRLIFVDLQGTGDYRLSTDSRRAFQEAVQRLYS